MKKILLISFVIFLSVSGAKTQNFTKDTATINQLIQKALQAYPNEVENLRNFAQEAQDKSKKINYQKGLAESYYLQGLMSKIKSDYDEELKWMLKAFKIFEVLKDQEAIAKTYNEIGFVYFQESEWDKALNYNNKALKIYQNNKNLQGETTSLMRIGNAYAEMKKPALAIASYEKALKIQEKLKNEKNIANILNNLGVVAYEQQAYAKAIDYHEKSLALLQKINLRERISAAYYNMGRAYLGQNDVDKAIALGKNALDWAIKMKIKQSHREACELLSNAYFQKGEYKEAYLFQKNFKIITDSIYNLESRSKIAQIQSLYDVESKEQKIRLLNQEKAIAQFWMYSIIGFVILVVIITTLIISNQRNKIKKNKELIEKNKLFHETEQALKQTELENQTLKNQALESSLAFKNKELTTFTLNFAQKNNMIQDIRQGIQEVINNTDKDSKIRLSRLIKLIDYTLNTDNDWEDFKLYFEQVHIGFFENLKNKHPELSSGELRLCALIRLNMNSKEMANILGISPESVKMARHRLRKKLNLSTEDNLIDFVLQY